MTRKYNFLDHDRNIVDGSVELRRIRRLSDGEIGGWLEGEHNLSHDGDCWVSGDAAVYGQAQVTGDALVQDDATVSGRARISGEARVGGIALVQDDAQVRDHAFVGGGAHVLGRGIVDGRAVVTGMAEVYGMGIVMGIAKLAGHATISVGSVRSGVWTESPFRIQGSKHLVQLTSDPAERLLTIGCQTLPIDAWFEEYQRRGETEGYTPAQIAEYWQHIRHAARTVWPRFLEAWDKLHS